jgi:ferritin-like protein
MIIMATTAITIHVESEAAKAFAEASPEEQRKIQLLLSLRLQDLTTSSPGKSLKTVMDEIGARAEARGLTPEILESLLRDE